MPIIKITKEQVEDAHRAREAALEKDPEFRAFEQEQEKHRKEAAKQHEREEVAS
jgi:hypothetical protein